MRISILFLSRLIQLATLACAVLLILTPLAVAAPNTAAQVAQRLAPLPLAQSPKPAKYGLVVCDPVAISPALAKFGEGCGRWLDLIAAGQPELGQTPLWTDRARAVQEMNRADFQLTPAQGAELRTITGANVAAFGKLSGTALACALTYRLHSLPSGAAIGPVLKAKGTEEQILAALPGIAKQIDALLEVPAPRIPSSVGLSPAQLMQAIAISHEDAPSTSDLAALGKLADLSPLAGIYYRYTDIANDFVVLHHMVNTLLTQQPENALIICLLFNCPKPEIRGPHFRDIRALTGRYPGSALLMHANVRMPGFTIGGKYTRASELVVQAAPNNPRAWIGKAASAAQDADYMRQGRTTDKITESEWAKLNSLYAEQKKAAKKATVLDPKYGAAWYELAVASTFASDTDTANLAINKALALGANKQEVYWWAIQMYQPKWFEDDKELARFLKLAIAEPWKDSGYASSIASELHSLGLNDEADAVMDDYIARQRLKIAKNPDDGWPHYELGFALWDQKELHRDTKLDEAIQEFRTAEKLMPNSPDIHSDLGKVLEISGQDADALAEYKLAMALDSNASIYYDRLLEKDKDAAKKEAAPLAAETL